MWETAPDNIKWDQKLEYKAVYKLRYQFGFTYICILKNASLVSCIPGSLWLLWISLRIQEKVTEKNEVKGLFQVGYQGVTFLSLAHDEDRRWHGAQPAPNPPGAPTSIQEEQEERDPHPKTSPSPHGPGIQRPEQGGMKTWLHKQEHSLQGDTHQKEYGPLEGRWPRTKDRLRYRCGGQASSGPHSAAGAHLKLGY